MADSLPSDLLARMARLMDSSEYTDLTIRCQGRVFNVHKSIVCIASPLLAANIKHATIEAQSSTIEHTEFDADTLGRFINYLYKQDYSLGDEPVIKKPVSGGKEDRGITGDTNHEETLAAVHIVNQILIIHSRVFAIADYYDVPALRNLAVVRFKSVAENVFNLDGFIEVVKEVISRASATDSELRDALKVVMLEHMAELEADNDFMGKLSCLESAQDLLVDIFRQLIRDHVDLKLEMASVVNCMEDSISLGEERIKVLEAQHSTTSSSHKFELELRQQQVEGLELGIERLIEAYEGLPEYCRNQSCPSDFNAVYVERFEGPGDSGPHWRVRCKKCRCRLNIV